MAIAKKNRFKKENVNIKLDTTSMPFPPEKIKYDSMTLVQLGKSNKEDLFPPSIEDVGMMRASMDGKIGQYIYSSENGDLYDALIYVDEVENVILNGIRTRLL